MADRIRVPREQQSYPTKIRPFVALGFDPTGESGNEYFGIGPFNDRPKFYVNQETGQWSDKVANKSGNMTTFFTEWELFQKRVNPLPKRKLTEVAEERGIPADKFLDAGMFWDGSHYVFPVYNQRGSIVNFRRFDLGKKVRGLPGIGVTLWGIERITDDTEIVVIAEGEWDTLAARQILWECEDRREDQEAGQIVVIGCPGSGTWKEDWNEFVRGRELVIAYDNDTAGWEGSARLRRLLSNRERKLYTVAWPDSIPIGYDVRDFYKDGGDWDTLADMLAEEAVEVENSQQVELTGSLQDRPSFEQTLAVYKKWLFLDKSMESALKVIFGTVLSNQLSGDPLWLHVVGSPGAGKTALLMSCCASPSVIAASSVTPHSLVSGYQNHGGADPSLIPLLLEKVFVVKDFTEVLQMPKVQRDEVYAILRGAYDGEVVKRFGNGVLREYKGHFSMITGVTHAIDGDNMSGLGERFLKYRLTTMRGTDNHEAMMLEAIGNVGKEHIMREELTEAALLFLNVLITPEMVPDTPVEMLYRLVALANIVSVLRTPVLRDYTRERIEYRPEPESGTRVAKQLKRMLIGLALVNSPCQVTEADYLLVQKCALDSCTPFHLDVVRYLFKNPDQTSAEIAKGINLPLSTLREHLDNMELLGIITKTKALGGGRGAPSHKICVSKYLTEQWEKAKL